MFCIRMVEATNHFFAAQPLELFWIDDDIRCIRATSELATARTMAILKNEFGSAKLVGDRLAQAAAPGEFVHAFNLQIASSVAHALSGQQIGCQYCDNLTQGFVGQFLFE